jgi:hypothetical protein
MLAMVHCDVAEVETVPPHPDVAMGVPFRENVIVPLGATGVKAAPVRLAVNVTAAFTAELATLGTMLMMGVSALMEYESDPGAAGTKLVSPEYVAVTAFEPAAMLDTVHCAAPEAETVPPHPAVVIGVPFRENVIVPLGATGVSVAPVRVAVNVTGVFTDALRTLGEMLMAGVAATTR